jgi:hypothetical protein
MFNSYDILYIEIDISDFSPLNLKKDGGRLMARIQISNDPSGRIIVSLPYAPLLVSKVKTIDARRWHPVDKHWSFPNTDGLQLRGTVPDFVVSAQSNDLRTTYHYPPPRWGREREGVKKLESPACPVGRGLSPKYKNYWIAKTAKQLKYIPM